MKIVPLLLGILILVGAGCVGAPPKQEYIFAQAALKAAKKSGAHKLASGFYVQAEEAYTKAESHYDDRDYSQARELFEKSQKLSEKAENIARLKKLKQGESFP